MWIEWLEEFENYTSLSKELQFEAFATCFACGGFFEVTTRCHITPKCEGGSDNVENLHLLCSGCHKESENISGDVYFNWFISKDLSNSVSFSNFQTKFKIILYHFRDNENCECKDCLLINKENQKKGISRKQFIESLPKSDNFPTNPININLWEVVEPTNVEPNDVEKKKIFFMIKTYQEKGFSESEIRTILIDLGYNIGGIQITSTKNEQKNKADNKWTLF